MEDFKIQTINMLRLLSSKSEQIDYAKNVPEVDITTELLCMWFDDLYMPDSKDYRDCFNDEELKVLETFNKFFNSKSELLPESRGTINTWHADSVWLDIMKAAKKTLEQIST